MIALALLMSLIGFLCLALAMERHHRDVCGGAPPSSRRRLLRAAAFFALATSFACCIRAWGVAYGVIGGFGALTVGATIVVLWLSFRAGPSRATERARSSLRS